MFSTATFNPTPRGFGVAVGGVDGESWGALVRAGQPTAASAPWASGAEPECCRVPGRLPPEAFVSKVF